jgi:hypothetical protein
MFLSAGTGREGSGACDERPLRLTRSAPNGYVNIVKQ